MLAQISIAYISIELIMSVVSLAMTGYFWLVKARRERPNLAFFQMGNFRSSLRRGNPETNTKHFMLAQVEPGGVLVANNSTIQNSIIRFDCSAKIEGRWLQGSQGYVEDNRPPWNIPPQSAISLSLCCFFEVPNDFETPDNVDVRIDFITASGGRFSHIFSKNVQQTQASGSSARAA